MKTLHISKLRVSHACIIVVCIFALFWIFHSSTPKPRNEWMPKASFIFNQNVNNVETFLQGKRIPRIIHQTWKDFKIPEMTEPWVTRCLQLHPDWEYWYWTDIDIRSLVADLYPQALPLFDSYPAGGYRADAFRYFVLYEYGGVYLDVDMECLKPLDDFVEKKTCFLTQEPLEHAHFLASMGVPLVSNAAMGCRRGHAFFEHVISDLSSHYGWFRWNDILRATGPYMLTEEYKYYIRNGLFFASEAQSDPITLALADDFQPTTDPSMRDHMRDACIHSEGHEFLESRYGEWQEKLCTKILSRGFAENPPPESYTDHHWTHTWAGERNDPYNIIGTDNYVDVRTVANKVKENQANVKQPH